MLHTASSAQRIWSKEYQEKFFAYCGVEYLRDYRDEQKWISSDSKMSTPGQKENLTEVGRKIEIQPFLIAKYTVTKSLYKAILHRINDHVVVNDTPVVNVSWYDAISFCNLFSKECVRAHSLFNGST